MSLDTVRRIVYILDMTTRTVIALAAGALALAAASPANADAPTLDDRVADLEAQVATLTGSVDVLVDNAASGAADPAVASLDRRLGDLEFALLTASSDAELADIRSAEALKLVEESAACVGKPTGFRWRVVSGNRVLVEAPSAKATVWLARVPKTCGK